MDSLGRFGGDEFAILVPGATHRRPRRWPTACATALAENVSVSVGVACFPADGVDRDALHQHADAEPVRGEGRPRTVAPTERDLTFASALAAAVNLRMAVPDEQTSTVPHFALAIGERLGFSDADTRDAAPGRDLHDVGKVSVPDEHPAQAPGRSRPRSSTTIKGHSGRGRGDRRPHRRADSPRRLDPPLARARRRLRLPGRPDAAMRSRWLRECCSSPTRSTRSRASARTASGCPPSWRSRSCGAAPGAVRPRVRRRAGRLPRGPADGAPRRRQALRRPPAALAS